MKQEDNKDLLFKDLCARLPYGVKVFYEYVDSLNKKTYGYSLTLNTWCIDEMKAEKAVVKPYLFPLSSMTEKQKKELFYLSGIDIIYGKFYTNNEFTLEETLSGINWLLKNHFDINGLIPMGLANDATGLNIY